MPASSDSTAKTAQCGCGAFKVTVSGSPEHVYTCSCLNCQRESGSVFTYCAIYPDAAVSTEGEQKTWRRVVPESGRWLESSFCPNCGVTVMFRMEAWPDVSGISVGCFADPTFPQPTNHYWAKRLHPWLSVPEGTKIDDAS